MLLECKSYMFEPSPWLFKHSSPGFGMCGVRFHDAIPTSAFSQTPCYSASASPRPDHNLPVAHFGLDRVKY